MTETTRRSTRLQARKELENANQADESTPEQSTSTAKGASSSGGAKGKPKVASIADSDESDVEMTDEEEEGRQPAKRAKTSKAARKGTLAFFEKRKAEFERIKDFPFTSFPIDVILEVRHA